VEIVLLLQHNCDNVIIIISNIIMVFFFFQNKNSPTVQSSIIISLLYYIVELFQPYTKINKYISIMTCFIIYLFILLPAFLECRISGTIDAYTRHNKTYMESYNSFKENIIKNVYHGKWNTKFRNIYLLLF